MSTWAAFAAKGAAVAATTAGGAGAAQAITPGALDGFAVGTLLTGMCALVIVAPRTMRKSRLSRGRGLSAAGLRHARVHPDYYAAPADTHSGGTAVEAGPAAAAQQQQQPPQQQQQQQQPQQQPAQLPQPEAPLTDVPQPELPLSFADPALEVLSPTAGQDYAGHAGADPYAAGVLDAVTYAPGSLAPDGFGSGGGLGSGSGLDPSSDDDIVLPGDDDAAQERGRGYRSKHRLTGQDKADRRTEPKRLPPRHAAPSSRFGTRLSSKLSVFPLAPARG